MPGTHVIVYNDDIFIGLGILYTLEGGGGGGGHGRNCIHNVTVVSPEVGREHCGSHIKSVLSKCT